MKVVPLEGTTMTVPELVELAKGEAVILTRNGQPLVAVREVSGSDWESTALANNPRFLFWALCQLLRLRKFELN